MLFVYLLFALSCASSRVDCTLTGPAAAVGDVGESPQWSIEFVGVTQNDETQKCFAYDLTFQFTSANDRLLQEAQLGLSLSMELPFTALSSTQSQSPQELVAALSNSLRLSRRTRVVPQIERSVIALQFDSIAVREMQQGFVKLFATERIYICTRADVSQTTLGRCVLQPIFTTADGETHFGDTTETVQIQVPVLDEFNQVSNLAAVRNARTLVALPNNAPQRRVEAKRKRNLRIEIPEVHAFENELPPKFLSRKKVFFAETQQFNDNSAVALVAKSEKDEVVNHCADAGEFHSETDDDDNIVIPDAQSRTNSAHSVESSPNGEGLSFELLSMSAKTPPHNSANNAYATADTKIYNDNFAAAITATAIERFTQRQMFGRAEYNSPIASTENILRVLRGFRSHSK